MCPLLYAPELGAAFTFNWFGQLSGFPVENEDHPRNLFGIANSNLSFIILKNPTTQSLKFNKF